ncbi:itaconate transport protein [Physcia stellaris]|nr:itaconate transport protein [Physcia stellaris]
MATAGNPSLQTPTTENAAKPPETASAPSVPEGATTADLTSSPEAAIPYTTFTKRQKRQLTGILILTMLASPLTATIYLPLLPLLAAKFNVSTQSINLTITIYVIFQAVSPLLFATASDSFGRRPIYLITYAIYTVASIGLAVNQHSYAALLILRALQSLGASAVLAIAFGVVADVCTPAERGSMLGPTQGAANLAWGFAWVFWALVIFGATVLLCVGFALPETARNVVGNGGLEATGWHKTWTSILLSQRRGKAIVRQVESGEKDVDYEGARSPRQTGTTARSMKDLLRLANPLAALRIIFWKDTALVLWMAASPYAVWYCVQASIPPIYQDIYGFDELQIGLSFLTGGFGTVLGGYLNGKLMDYNYKVTARQIGHTIDRVSGDNLDKFPIERARARGSWSLLLIYIGTLAGYGWSIHARAHESVPLILQFILAALCTAFQQTFNALLVDVFPASPSTAAASSNITRCLLSALGLATLQPLVNAMGRHWFFTMLAVLSGGGGLLANWVMNAYGMQWRLERIGKMKAKAGADGAVDL